MVLNLLVKPGWVLLENLVQDRLGHATFGLVAAASALAIVVATLADLGLTQFTVQRMAGEVDFAQRHFDTLLPLRGLLAVAALAGLLLVGWVLGYRGLQLEVLGAIGAGLLLVQYAQFLRAPVQGKQHFNTDAFLSVFEKLLALGLVGGLALGGGPGLSSYVGARLAASAFTAVLFLGLLRRLFGPLPWGWPRRAATGQLLRGALPFALILLLSGINERIDMVLLERLAASKEEAGYYAAGYRWLDAVMMYAWTILPLFFARFAYVQRRPRELRQLLWLGQRVVAVPLLLAVAFVLFRGEVLFWQFGHSTPAELARMVWCLKLLFLNVLVNALLAVYGTLLTATHQQRAVSWLVAASIGLNVALNLLLLPRYGAPAAALNTLASNLLLCGGYVVLVIQRMPVAVPWHLLARLALAFGLLCGGWFLARTYLELSWWLETGLMSVFFALLLPLTGLVQRRDFK